ncbi:MAG: ABC transporter permease [Propionivibrio sp.]
MLGLALVLGLILALSSEHFLTANNLLNLLDQSVVIGVVAIGMTFVILTGGIDLSVGSVAGLTGIILGLAMREMPIPAALFLAIACGAAIGLLSGVLVAVFGLAPFVVTLGMMAICRSLAYVVSGQQSISDVPESLGRLVDSSTLGVPMNVVILLSCYAVAWAYLTWAKGGRTIYAIGSNLEAARIAGLAATRYRILVYVVCGALFNAFGRADRGAVALDRPAGRERHGTGRHCRRGHRRGQPVRRARLGARHADGRIHHGHDPQRHESAGDFTVLAGRGHRQHHHRRGPHRAPDGPPDDTLSIPIERSFPCSPTASKSSMSVSAGSRWATCISKSSTRAAAGARGRRISPPGVTWCGPTSRTIA